MNIQKYEKVVYYDGFNGNVAFTVFVFSSAIFMLGFTMYLIKYLIKLVPLWNDTFFPIGTYWISELLIFLFSYIIGFLSQRKVYFIKKNELLYKKKA